MAYGQVIRDRSLVAPGAPVGVNPDDVLRGRIRQGQQVRGRALRRALGGRRGNRAGSVMSGLFADYLRRSGRGGLGYYGGR